MEKSIAHTLELSTFLSTIHSPLSTILGGRLMVGRLALNEVMKVRFLLPEQCEWRVVRASLHYSLSTISGGHSTQTAKRPSSNLGDRLWVRLPPVLDASAGHWRASVPVKHARYAVQVQLLPDALTARWSSGFRMPAPHAGGMGSIPIRANG